MRTAPPRPGARRGSAAASRPKVVSKGACQEVVHTGDEVNITRLPIQTCWPGDPTCAISGLKMPWRKSLKITRSLDVSRIETNRLQIHRQPIQWIDFIEKRVSAFRVQHRVRTIRFDVGAPESTISVDHPLRSQKRRYMRRRMSAQS